MAFAVTALGPVWRTVSMNFLLLSLGMQQSTTYWVSVLPCRMSCFYPVVTGCVWDVINAFCSCRSAWNCWWALIHPCVSVLGTSLVLSGSLGWQALPKGYGLGGHTDKNEAFPSPVMTFQANQSHLQGSRFRGRLRPRGNWQEEDILPTSVQTRYLSSLVWSQCTSLFWHWCS